ncbi:hypothetical protein FQR65_LT09477 [Abscondita terminalis]|nr:hypothetical protein FQR65_LT09477 [Abscondita terminalis]
MNYIVGITVVLVISLLLVGQPIEACCENSEVAYGCPCSTECSCRVIHCCTKTTTEAKPCTSTTDPPIATSAPIGTPGPGGNAPT